MSNIEIIIAYYYHYYIHSKYKQYDELIIKITFMFAVLFLIK